MKRNRIPLVCVRLAAGLLFLGLTPPLKAEFTCKQKLMAGSWADTLSVTSLERQGLDIFPQPGPFSFVGLVVLDESGKGIVNRHTNNSPSGVARPDLLQFFDLQVTVKPDCTGRWFYTLRNLPPSHPFVSQFGLKPGQVVIDLDIVCANGQSECWGVPTVPSFQVGTATLKRMDPLPQSLKARIDALMRWLGGPQSALSDSP